MYITHQFPNNNRLKKNHQKINYKPLEMNENESMAFENLWCASKPTLRGNITAGNNHIKKKFSNYSPTTLTKGRSK